MQHSVNKILSTFCLEFQLTPGTKLWFRVSVTKGKTVAVVSDPYTIMVV